MATFKVTVMASTEVLVEAESSEDAIFEAQEQNTLEFEEEDYSYRAWEVQE